MGEERLVIVFDGPPGPEAGRFVEVENGYRKGVDVGTWVKRDDGLWELVLHKAEMLEYFGGGPEIE